MTINERFEKIINDIYSGNKRSFSLSVGISPTVVENIVGQRRGKPSYDVIEKVCANANINPEWLILEKGCMKKEINFENSEILKTNTVDNTFLLDRIEKLAIDNNELRKEIEQMKSKSSRDVGPTPYNIRKETLKVAEADKNKLTK